MLIRWQSGHEALAKIARMQAGDPIRIEQTRSIYRNSAPGLITTYVTVSRAVRRARVHRSGDPHQDLIFISVMTLQTGARLVLYRAFAKRVARPRRLEALGGSVRRRCIRRRPHHRFRRDLDDGREPSGHADHRPARHLCGNGRRGRCDGRLPARVLRILLRGLHRACVLALLAAAMRGTSRSACCSCCGSRRVAEQARRTSRQFADTIRLRIENQDLVQDLRREKAAAEEANVAKSRFLASASHDLRQPVHAMSLFVAALRSHDMNAEARGLLDHIDTSVRSLSGLFGGLLDISRLDAGVVEVRRSPFAIHPLMERVCKDYRAEAAKKGVQLRVRPSHAFIDSDPILFERILRNIVANAVAYTDRGTVLVGSRRGPERLRIQVLDTGHGIESNEQPLGVPGVLSGRQSRT